MRRAPVLRRDPDARRAVPEFDRGRFWGKLARSALAAGREVVEKALWLYYAAERPDVPRWAKLTIYGALAYFVLPLDAIPDLIPGAGYVDDLGALGTALLTVASYVDEDVKRRARQRMEQWFGALPGRRD
jgi:uncharacterized membrane protein YkvA (DUF1232 family)